MDYDTALEFAGATVHVYESFGSYQGQWWALVTYEGKTGWVTGGYGSCSGCDAIQGHAWSHEHEHADGFLVRQWSLEHLRDDCADCRALRAEIVDFGREYLGEIMSHEAALREASEQWESPERVAEMIAKHAKRLEGTR